MIEGYRHFSVDEDTGYLVGAYSKEWKSKELVACCFGPIHHNPLNLPYFKNDLTDMWLPDGSHYQLSRGEWIAFKHLSDELESCSCGIYIVKTLQDLPRYVRPPILAKVTGYGAVHEKELGWQVSHCRIEHLWIDIYTIRFRYISMLDDFTFKMYFNLYLRGLKALLEETYEVECEIGAEQ